MSYNYVLSFRQGIHRHNGPEFDPQSDWPNHDLHKQYPKMIGSIKRSASDGPNHGPNHLRVLCRS